MPSPDVPSHDRIRVLVGAELAIASATERSLQIWASGDAAQSSRKGGGPVPIAADERDRRDSPALDGAPLTPSFGLQGDRRDPCQRAQPLSGSRAGAAAGDGVGASCGEQAGALKSRRVCSRADCLRLMSPTDVLSCPHSMSFNAASAVPLETPDG
jgi:hypothetical protein